MRRFFFLVVLTVTATASAQTTSDKAYEYFEKGYYAIDEGNYRKAIDLFEKAIEIDSTGDCGTEVKGKAHGELAFAHLKKGDTAEALDYIDEALALDSTNPYPRHTRALILDNRGQTDEALKELDKVIEMNPEFLSSWIQRGFVHYKNKNYAQARADFYEGLRLNKEQHLLPKEAVKQIKDIVKDLKKY